MPSLTQMFATCNAKSYYSRPEGEIYSALSEAGFLVYSAVIKEYANFFLKFDTTVTLVPGTQTYLLPPDLTQIVSIAEKLPTSKRWRLMDPESVTDAMLDAQDSCGWSAYEDYDRSEFSFAGPFLTAAAATAVQTQSIMVSPEIIDTRMVEIAYTAKWIPILNAKSFLMLPDELTYAMQNFAIAELLRSNSDSLSTDYEQKGLRHLTSGLTWARSRQIVQGPTITPYL